MIAKRIKRVVVVSLCIVFITSFLTLEAFSEPNTLIVGHAGEPDHLFPMTVSLPTIDRVYHIAEPMVFLDPDAKPIPVLATKWEVVDGNKWRFHLRKGVVFHNGDKFTAEDVGFTIDYVKDPKNKCERIGLARGYNYKIIDDYTVDIMHEKGTVDPVLPPLWYALPMLPKNALAKMGTEKFSREPIGTGPFQFVEWKPGTHVILKAFDKYWGGKPKIERIIFKTVPEAATRVVGLKTGDLDIINDVPPTEVKSIEADPKLEIRKKSSLYVMFLQLRTDIPPFKDNIDLRKAVAHAIDSETICKQVIGGFAVPVGSITPSTAFGYSANAKPYKYDPQLAKQYLEKSGYKGEVIDFLSTNGKYFMDMEVNTAIAGYLKAIGINVNLQLTDWPSWMAKFNSRKIEPICLYGWCDNSGDAVENLFDFAHKRSPYNWSDEKGIAGFDKLIDTAQTVLDMKIRGEALKKANQLLNEYYHCGIYYNPVKVFGARKGIKNWLPRADESIYISNKVEKSF